MLMNNDYSKIGLYPHNVESYKKVWDCYTSDERFLAIVHGTGTGKSYNALQLIYDVEEDSKIEVLDIDEAIEQELDNGKILYGCRLTDRVPGLDKYIMAKERYRLRRTNGGNL